MTRSGDVQVVIREGKRIRTGHLDVRVRASPLGHSRVGIVVPLYRRTAVERNRLKRQLRELVRKRLLPRLRGRGEDVVIRARREAFGSTSGILEQEIETIGERI